MSVTEQTPSASEPPPSRKPPPAWAAGVAVVAAIDAAVLLATVPKYGYHRDELYFRLLAAHPAWGYVDEPPFTPMLVKAGIVVFGDNLWALRVPAMLFAVAAVILTAGVARELGGGKSAQVLAAAGASCTFLFVAGHVLLTATPDLVVWLLVLLFATRALMRDHPRWWLAAGATVGVGLYNKQLILLLVVALAAGIALVGPRRQLRSGWPWLAVGIALLVAAPNIAYQVAHGWPEASMAHAIAAHKGHDDRVFFVPFQLVLLGVPVAPLWIAGLISLLRRPQFRSVRAFGYAYLVLCVLVFATGGQPYYTFGLQLYLLAAGSVVAAAWARRRRRRQAALIAAVGLNAAIGVVLALPVFPVTSLPSVIASINQAERDTVGWPAYVHEVARVYDRLPRSDRSKTVIITGNYGEAGAIARFGGAYGLPPVFSGQNELFNYGPPAASASVVIAVGLQEQSSDFRACTPSARLDDHVGVSNEEQGRPIYVCRGPRRPWPALWSDFQHYD